MSDGTQKAYIVFTASASFFMGYYVRLVWGIISSFSSLHPTTADDGLVFSLFFLTYIIVQFPAGVLSDRLGSRNIISMALVGLAVSSFISGAASSMTAEYLGSLLMGFSAGWIYPATIRLLSSQFHADGLARAIGYYTLAWPISIIMLGATLPWTVEYLGWRWGYYTVAVACALLAALTLKMSDSRSSSSSGGLFSVSLLKDRNVLMLSLGGFCFFLSYWTLTLFLYKFLLTEGMSAAHAGLIYSLTAVLGLVTTIASGRIISRLSVSFTLAVTVIAYGVLIALIPSTVDIYLLAAIALTMGGIRFVVTPAQSTAAAVIGGAHAGSVSGAANVFWQLSGLAAGALAPYIIQATGFSSLWYAMGGICALSSVFYISMRIGAGPKT
ncbi:MAG: MFS transporter [Nitrososphaerota archaeon]|nr:MFS transporter [Nitrososphaerota archaeon]MDG7043687.1 MFS transporter [Nitrososphaerota archaeon]